MSIAREFQGFICLSHGGSLTGDELIHNCIVCSKIQAYENYPQKKYSNIYSSILNFFSRVELVFVCNPKLIFESSVSNFDVPHLRI